jgi:DNA-binding MarR family transcriptional regulator
MSQEAAAKREAATLGRGFMLWQIANGWQRAMRAALAPTGLTYVQVMLLAGLSKRAEGARVSQASLAQSLGADVMMTSQVLRALEADGLVRRDRDPSDTRARLLRITEAGALKLAEALPLVDLADERFFEALGRKEDRFVKAMRKLWRKRRTLGMGPEKAEAPEGEPAGRHAGKPKAPMPS